MVMSANGELLVLGTTSSYDFPTTVTAFDNLTTEAKAHLMLFLMIMDLISCGQDQPGWQPADCQYIPGWINNDWLKSILFSEQISPCQKL